MAIFGKTTQPIGLDIGNESIKVAQLKPAADPILQRYGEERTSGCLVDGEVTDINVLASSITNLLKKTGITERKVVLGISNQKVIARLFTMPYMEKEDLDSAVKFQAQENIPIPVADTILDYQVVNDFTNEDNERTLQLLLVAAQKEMINNHIAALEKAKLKPCIVDVSSFALSRALLGKEAVVPDDKEIEKNAKAIGLVDIGESVTNIAIIFKRKPLFNRVIPIGDDTFTKAVSDELAMSLDEAEKIKEEIGFAKPEVDLTDGLKESQLEVGKKVRSILDLQGKKFIGEIKRSFNYGLSEAVHSEELFELIVSGVGTDNKNLILHLKQNFQKVSIGDALSAVSLPSGSGIKNQSNFAIAIGLALRGINE